MANQRQAGKMMSRRLCLPNWHRYEILTTGSVVTERGQARPPLVAVDRPHPKEIWPNTSISISYDC